MLPYEELSNLSSTEYKKYHESFMQNNHGSTALHTFFCIYFTVQCSLYICITPKIRGFNQYIYEYIVIVLPLIAIHTFLSHYIYFLNFIVNIFIFIKLINQISKFRNTYVLKNDFKTNRIQAISCLRGLTYLITVFSILAVDFRDYPRYLSKTERYGYSLMDTGVGLFVLMSGIVHKDISKDNYVKITKSNIKFVFILLFLGTARFVSVKQLDYQEHVTEYGVHWNFFFTLAVCKVFSSIILCVFKNTCVLSAFILVLHELLLYTSFQDWVFSSEPRNSLISANREGLSSSLGYVSLYLFAAYVKKVLSDKTITRYKIQMVFGIGSILLWVLTYLINVYRPASRVLANAGYCVHLEAYLVTVLTVLYFFEVLFYDNEKLHFQIPQILIDVNTNGLLYFLIANLLTGAVNLSIRTLDTSSLMTFVILNVYMTATIAFIVLLNKLHIKI